MYRMFFDIMATYMDGCRANAILKLLGEMWCFTPGGDSTSILRRLVGIVRIYY